MILHKDPHSYLSRIQTFENKSYKKILHISYKEHKTNAYVRDKINTYAGKQEQLLSVIKCGKLAGYGHVARYDFLSKTIMQGTVNSSLFLFLMAYKIQCGIWRPMIITKIYLRHCIIFRTYSNLYFLRTYGILSLNGFSVSGHITKSICTHADLAKMSGLLHHSILP
jgi:hypothetical protein